MDPEIAVTVRWAQGAEGGKNFSGKKMLRETVLVAFVAFFTVVAPEVSGQSVPTAAGTLANRQIRRLPKIGESEALEALLAAEREALAAANLAPGRAFRTVRTHAAVVAWRHTGHVARLERILAARTAAASNHPIPRTRPESGGTSRLHALGASREEDFRRQLSILMREHTTAISELLSRAAMEPSILDFAKRLLANDQFDLRNLEAIVLP